MKKVRCPKCDHYLPFDETRYTKGETLVFECPNCHKQFGIRLGDAPKEERQDCGALLVIENVFHFQQTLPLQMGDNVVGRYVKGSDINVPIETVDPSVDTKHCVLNVSRNRAGQFIYTLRDTSPDGTGTFVGNTILRHNDRLRIENGTIINIGATTMILRAAGCEEEETTAEQKH